MNAAEIGKAIGERIRLTTPIADEHAVDDMLDIMQMLNERMDLMATKENIAEVLNMIEALNKSGALAHERIRLLEQHIDSWAGTTTVKQN